MDTAKLCWLQYLIAKLDHNKLKVNVIVLITQATWSKSLRKIYVGFFNFYLDGNGIDYCQAYKILLL